MKRSSDKQKKINGHPGCTKGGDSLQKPSHRGPEIGFLGKTRIS